MRLEFGHRPVLPDPTVSARLTDEQALAPPRNPRRTHPDLARRSPATYPATTEAEVMSTSVHDSASIPRIVCSARVDLTTFAGRSPRADLDLQIAADADDADCA